MNQMRIFKTAVYAIILFIVIFMSVYFKSYYLLTGAALLIAVPLFDIILFLLPVGSIKAEIKSSKTDYIKGEQAEIFIILKSTKPFPTSGVKTDVVIKNKFYNEEKITFEIPLPVFFARKIKIPFKIDKSGIIEISVKNTEYKDMLGFFYKKSDLKTVYTIIAMPLKENISQPAFGSIDSDEIPAANVYLNSRGDLSGYREYRDGDRKNNISWKLFARTEKLFVREFEKTSADEPVILFDMCIDNIDKALDILYNIDFSKGYTLLWLPKGREEFETAYISDNETLRNNLYRIFSSPPETIPDKAISEYRKLYRENKVLYISDKMELL